MTKEEAIKVLNEGRNPYHNIDRDTWCEAFNMAIESLNQQPCEDAINRQTVLDIAKSSKSNWIDNSVLFKRVNELPSVNPQEPKWIPVSERLPEEPDFYSNVLPADVLVWERHYSYKAEDYVEGYNIGWCWRGKWVVNGGGEFEVLAWKPLPKPYIKEDK